MTISPEIMKKLCFDLKRLRAESKLTQAKVCSKLGWNRSFLAQIETGRKIPNLDHLHLLGLVYKHDLVIKYRKRNNLKKY